MRKIEDFDSVIRLFEIYESEREVHLVLECLEGGELFEKIKEHGSYDEVEAAKIMKGLLEGLVEIHSKGIVHRDIKPENIIFK